jgi:AbrB family looped-hinge helix DNA binding protein
MTKSIKEASSSGMGEGRMSCCKVESLISVDERGQMVLPKEIRDKANIGPGDKLALVSWEKEGRVCCFTLFKVEEFTNMVKGFLGPMMGEMLPKSKAR